MVGTNLQITWTAVDPTKGNAPYNPCNADYATGPIFFGAVGLGRTEGCTNTPLGCQSNMSIVRAYAIGVDWMNDGLTGSSAPGQPAGSTTLAAANTTCAGNVATTWSFPSQTQAMAVTSDAGAAPWNILLDDAVSGPTTAACMTCHQAWSAEEQARLRGHAFDFSWTPQVFPGGRQDLMIP